MCPNRAGGLPILGKDSAAAAVGAFAVPTAEGKKGRHLRFLPSLNTRFPCNHSLGADGRLRKQEKGNGRGFLLPCLSQPIRSVGYITATQAVLSPQARHTRVAQLVSLEFADSTYGLGVRCNLSSQVPCVTTCQGFARHCYVAPCVELPICVAIRCL